MTVRVTWALAVGVMFLTSVVSAQVSADIHKDKIMLLDKPYFTLRLNVRDCPYTVEMNGAMVNKDKQGQSSTVNIPVNHWMRSGTNELTLSILTFKGKRPISTDALCEVNLQVRPDGGTEAQTVTISRLVFSSKMASVGKGIEESSSAGQYDSKHQFLAGRNGDVTISAATIGPLPDDDKSKLVRQTISLQTPFPEWAFFKSDALPEVDTLADAEYVRYVESLVVYYKRIYDALKSKNVDSILPMFEERNRETDQAFYFPAGTTAKKIAKALKSAANDPDLELLGGVTEENLMTRTHDNFKLIELVRNDGDAIVFNIRGGGSESYPIIFRKQGDKWIITR